jgi:hypothetical protein
VIENFHTHEHVESFLVEIMKSQISQSRIDLNQSYHVLSLILPDLTTKLDIKKYSQSAPSVMKIKVENVNILLNPEAVQMMVLIHHYNIKNFSDTVGKHYNFKTLLLFQIIG